MATNKIAKVFKKGTCFLCVFSSIAFKSHVFRTQRGAGGEKAGERTYTNKTCALLVYCVIDLALQQCKSVKETDKQGKSKTRKTEISLNSICGRCKGKHRQFFTKSFLISIFDKIIKKKFVNISVFGFYFAWA